MRARAGRVRDAEADYTHAIEINPSHVEALVNRGVIRAEEGRVAEASADYQAAAAADPHDPDIPFNVAKLLMDSGDLTAALRYAETAAK